MMAALIPEIQIEIYNAFDKLMENGKDGVQFEIITIRAGARVPLLYESCLLYTSLTALMGYGTIEETYERYSDLLVRNEDQNKYINQILGEEGMF